MAAAIALIIPQASLAQRGGHGGGFSSHGFGGGLGGSYSGSAARSFPAPRMDFPSGQMGFGTSARSPFGQLRAPSVARRPYPGVAHNGNWSGGYSHGHYPYRPPYHRTVAVYAAPLYTVPWFGAWPYFGNWDAFDDTYAPDTGAAPDQSYPPESETQPASQAEARPAYQSAYPSAASLVAPGPEPSVTIVYKDGHSQQIHNYALTRTALLLLDEAATGRTPQIPLADINLAATEQVNRDAGVDFRPPIAN